MYTSVKQETCPQAGPQAPQSRCVGQDPANTYTRTEHNLQLMSAWDFQIIPISKVQDVDRYKLKTGTEFKINKKARHYRQKKA